MAFENYQMGRQKVLYNNANDDNPVVYQLKVDGEKVTPTSATIEIYKPGSTTAVLAATAMSKSGTLLTYSVDTTTVADFPVDEGYRGEIVVTYNSLTYDAQIVFDVAKFLLRYQVAWDQLVALDDSIVGMKHNGEEDLSPLIEACRDDLQADLESKIVKGKALKENYILDDSRVSSVFRLFILAQLHLNKGNMDHYEIYFERFQHLKNAVLSAIKYDTDEDGQESGDIGGLHEITLEL